MKCTGQPPAPRSFHSVTAAGSRVVVIGGRAENNDHLADLHVFDLGKCFEHWTHTVEYQLKTTKTTTSTLLEIRQVIRIVSA